MRINAWDKIVKKDVKKKKDRKKYHENRYLVSDGFKYSSRSPDGFVFLT